MLVAPIRSWLVCVPPYMVARPPLIACATYPNVEPGVIITFKDRGGENVIKATRARRSTRRFEKDSKRASVPAPMSHMSETAETMARDEAPCAPRARPNQITSTPGRAAARACLVGSCIVAKKSTDALFALKRERAHSAAESQQCRLSELQPMRQTILLLISGKPTTHNAGHLTAN